MSRKTRCCAHVFPALLVAVAGLAASPASGQLVVNEIDYDQENTDSAEFVEIKNVSGGFVDMADYELLLVNGATGVEYDAVALPPVGLPPSGYFVVCADELVVANCDLNVDPDTNWLQNGAPDAVAIARVVDGAIIDTVSYEGDTAPPFTEGSGVGLEDDPAVVASGLSRSPDGLDSESNNTDLSPRCVSPGRANVIEDSGCIAGSQLEVTGECPGTILMTYSGGAPDGIGGIVFSSSGGTDPLAAGPCAGTPTGLDEPQLLTVLALDGGGGFSLSRTAPAAACGALVQVVDGATCELSNAAALP